MDYGHFSADGREFLITNVATPSPWINYLQNGRYFATISANGGGISYDRSPLHGRITRYRINDVPPDRPGKYIYVKDRDTGEIWSLTWQPVGRSRRGLPGRPRLRLYAGRGRGRGDRLDGRLLRSARRRSGDLEGRPDQPVGPAAPARRRRLCRVRPRPRPHRPHQPMRRPAFQPRPFRAGPQRALRHQDLLGDGDARHPAPGEQGMGPLGLLHRERPVAAYETLRERFIGPFRNETDPLGARARPRLQGYGLRQRRRRPPGRPRARPRRVERRHLLARRHPQGRVRAEQARRSWRNTATRRRSTPPWPASGRSGTVSSAMPGSKRPTRRSNVFLNYWTPYQAKVAFDVGRVASFYYWGIGRGFGYRDTAQDTIAIVLADPARARERVLLLARQMRTRRQGLSPFLRRRAGRIHRALRRPALVHPGRHRVLKETGDFGLLDTVEPFLDGGERARSSTTFWPSSGFAGRGSRPARPAASSAAATGTTRSTTSAARTAARASGAGCSMSPCSTACSSSWIF